MRLALILLAFLTTSPVFGEGLDTAWAKIQARDAKMKADLDRIQAGIDSMEAKFKALTIAPAQKVDTAKRYYIYGYPYGWYPPPVVLQPPPVYMPPIAYPYVAPYVPMYPPYVCPPPVVIVRPR